MKNIKERNLEIFKKYNSGQSPLELANDYNLSTDTIRRIIRSIKNNNTTTDNTNHLKNNYQFLLVLFYSNNTNDIFSKSNIIGITNSEKDAKLQYNESQQIIKRCIFLSSKNDIYKNILNTYKFNINIVKIPKDKSLFENKDISKDILNWFV